MSDYIPPMYWTERFRARRLALGPLFWKTYWSKSFRWALGWAVFGLAISVADRPWFWSGPLGILALTVFGGVFCSLMQLMPRSIDISSIYLNVYDLMAGSPTYKLTDITNVQFTPLDRETMKMEFEVRTRGKASKQVLAVPTEKVHKVSSLIEQAQQSPSEDIA